MGRLVMIDHHDSFTWNVVQSLALAGTMPEVVETDRVDVDDVLRRADGIVLGPGPGRPGDYPTSVALARRATGRIPILGVCLGHQTIAHAFGAAIVRAPLVVHGKTCEVAHDGTGVFSGIASPVRVARYNSLVVDPDGIPDGFVVHARAEDGTVQGLRHRSHPVEGVQFHPEAFLSESGQDMARNWLVRAGFLAAPVES